MASRKHTHTPPNAGEKADGFSASPDAVGTGAPDRQRDPPRRASGLFEETVLRPLRDAAGERGIDLRAALLNELLHRPFRQRSLLKSATLMKSMSTASIGELEQALRLEFFEWLADLAIATRANLLRVERKAREGGGKATAAKGLERKQRKLDNIAEAERQLLKEGIPFSKLNKAIAKRTGLSVLYVQRARAQLKKESAPQLS